MPCSRALKYGKRLADAVSREEFLFLSGSPSVTSGVWLPHRCICSNGLHIPGRSLQQLMDVVSLYSASHIQILSWYESREFCYKVRQNFRLKQKLVHDVFLNEDAKIHNTENALLLIYVTLFFVLMVKERGNKLMVKKKKWFNKWWEKWNSCWQPLPKLTSWHYWQLAPSFVITTFMDAVKYK